MRAYQPNSYLRVSKSVLKKPVMDVVLVGRKGGVPLTNPLAKYPECVHNGYHTACHYQHHNLGREDNYLPVSLLHKNNPQCRCQETQHDRSAITHEKPGRLPVVLQKGQ
jgi:hypothetical protein